MKKNALLLGLGAVALYALSQKDTFTVQKRTAQGVEDVRISSPAEGVAFINKTVASGDLLVSPGRTLETIPEGVTVQAGGRTFVSGMGTVSQLGTGETVFLGVTPNPAIQLTAVQQNLLRYNGLDPNSAFDQRRARERGLL